MQTLVLLKTVLDPHPDLRFTMDGRVEQDEPEALYLLDPASHCALEEAMRLQEQYGGEVRAVSLGSDEARLGLQIALARGVNQAIHLRVEPNQRLEGLSKVALLAEEAHRHRVDLILCGEKSLDGCSGSTGPMLAELLELPQVTRAVHLQVAASEDELVIERSLEKGDRVRLACPLPALVTVTAQVNTPRYISFYRWQHVQQSSIEVRGIKDFESVSGSTCRVETGLPKPRPRRVAIPGSATPAADRMRLMMSGGRAATPKKEGGIFAGSPAEAAERIFNYLLDKGYI